MTVKDLLWVDILNGLKLLNKEYEYELRKKIKALIDLERKDVKNKQLIEIPALRLRTGDLIFDYYHKTVKKVHYAEYRKKCQFNIDHHNTEILVSYSEDEPCDYFDQFDNVTILVDIAEVDSIQNRENLYLVEYD